MSCDEPMSSSADRSQPLSSRGPATPAGQVGAPTAQEKLITREAMGPKKQFSTQRDATYKWPWRKICNEPIPPTGSMVRRPYGLINQGSRPPT
eukprot:6440086-Pyramimonas_sp.AAC.1